MRWKNFYVTVFWSVYDLFSSCSTKEKNQKKNRLYGHRRDLLN